MEELKDTIKPELIITEGKAFHFTGNHLDEIIIVKESEDNKYRIENHHYPIYKLMKHPKRNIFLDELDVSWVYQNIAYPELFVSREFLDRILKKEIPDALSFSLLLLETYNLHQYIDSKSFSELVLNNKHIDTRKRLMNACQLIKVDCKRSSIDEMHLYLQEIINDNDRAKLIGKFANADIKIDLSETTPKLEEEWLGIEVSYTGDIELPEHFFLCKTFKDFIKLGCNSWYIRDNGTIDHMMFKQKFFIGCITDEKILFEVEPIEGTSWFTFSCRSANGEKNYNNTTVALGYALAQKNNQLFFQKNHEDTNPLKIKTINFMDDLIDNLL